MNSNSRSRCWLAVVLAGMLVVTGCRYEGLSTLPLPFTPASGDGSYQVTVRMTHVGSLVPNSEVKVDDVTVGTVRKIEFDDWQAKLTVALEKDVRLPANAVAAVGQKSLLGAQYLGLSAPPGKRPVGRLTPGSEIPASRTDRYPETEELLATTSLLLNGGGLSQFNTVVSEFNRAFGGREAEIRQFLGRFRDFARELAAQKEAISKGIEATDRLAGTVAERNEVLETAIRRLAPGIEVLAEEQSHFTKTLTALAELADVSDRVVQASRRDLAANLRDLKPVIRELADSGDDLPQLARYVTYPFDLHAVPNIVRGDWVNGFITLDLTWPSLNTSFLSGTPLDGLLHPLLGENDGNRDPMEAPLVPQNLFGDGPEDATGPEDPSDRPGNEDSNGGSGPLDGLIPGGGS